MIHEKYGFWSAGNEKYQRKFDALYNASKLRPEKPVGCGFHYHDEVWRGFDRRLLGKIRLNTLYKERAQQLRDRYDYLVLYYSGGADSHNILRTYLDNGIKLDEVCVKWSPIINELYPSNNTDTSISNFWSEWDYAIKPTLDWLKQRHPEIKITIRDFLDDIQNMESLFEQVDHTRSGAMYMWKPYHVSLSDGEKKNVGHIYGIDKPELARVGKNHIAMFFDDTALSMVSPGRSNPTNGECFYWAPDFPILPMEMAYQLASYMVDNPSSLKFLYPYNERGNYIDFKLAEPGVTLEICRQYQSDLAKKVLYTTWDNRFQAGKNHSEVGSDKFFWFFQHPEFGYIRDVFRVNNYTLVSAFSEKYLRYDSLNKTWGMYILTTEMFFVRHINPPV